MRANRSPARTACQQLHRMALATPCTMGPCSQHYRRVQPDDPTELRNARGGKAQFMRDVGKPDVRAEQSFRVWHNRNQASSGSQRLPDSIEQLEELRSCVMLEHAERADHRVSIRPGAEIVESRSVSDAHQPPRRRRMDLAGAQVDALDARVTCRSQRIQKSAGPAADVENRCSRGRPVEICGIDEDIAAVRALEPRSRGRWSAPCRV